MAGRQESPGLRLGLALTRGLLSMRAMPWSAPFHLLRAVEETQGGQVTLFSTGAGAQTGPSGWLHGRTALGWWLQAALSLKKGLAS